MSILGGLYWFTHASVGTNPKCIVSCKVSTSKRRRFGKCTCLQKMRRISSCLRRTNYNGRSRIPDPFDQTELVESNSIVGTMDERNLRKTTRYQSTFIPPSSSSPSFVAGLFSAPDEGAPPPVTLLRAPPIHFFVPPELVDAGVEVPPWYDLRCSSIIPAFIRSITFFITDACLQG